MVTPCRFFPRGVRNLPATSRVKPCPQVHIKSGKKRKGRRRKKKRKKGGRVQTERKLTSETTAPAPTAAPR